MEHPDILGRIETLRCERGWSIYRLSKESGVPASTIYNLTRCKTEPRLQTLKALCTAFGVPLSDFIAETSDNTALSARQQLCLKYFNTLDSATQDSLLAYMEGLTWNIYQ